jgi:hypothetical protein
LRLTILANRGITLAGIATLIAGSVLIGNYKDAHSVSLGEKLVKTGYIIITIIIFFIACFAAGFWMNRRKLSRNGVKVCISFVAHCERKTNNQQGSHCYCLLDSFPSSPLDICPSRYLQPEQQQVE